MSVRAFQALRDELLSVRHIISSHKKKTLRDNELLERIRSIYRSWVYTVKPGIEPFLRSKKELLKLSNDLEKLALLTSKFRPISRYLKRLGSSIEIASSLVLVLPPETDKETILRPHIGEGLFLSEIPDLSIKLVPNSILGWRAKFQSFLHKYPFDKSVFIMIRYRKQNENLISSIKKELSSNNLNGILASEHNLTDDLYNPIACLLACSKGIAVFDKPEEKQVFNPNVAYELGTMHLLTRPCLILKHKSLKSLHTDILMKLYVDYNSKSDACKEVKRWLDDEHY